MNLFFETPWGFAPSFSMGWETEDAEPSLHPNVRTPESARASRRSPIGLNPDRQLGPSAISTDLLCADPLVQPEASCKLPALSFISPS
jgi:hypothetical protein